MYAYGLTDEGRNGPRSNLLRGFLLIHFGTGTEVEVPVTTRVE